jgi:uncharacterized membrane protein YvlD (DUF360 family)
MVCLKKEFMSLSLIYFSREITVRPLLSSLMLPRVPWVHRVCMFAVAAPALLMPSAALTSEPMMMISVFGLFLTELSILSLNSWYSSEIFLSQENRHSRCADLF